MSKPKLSTGDKIHDIIGGLCCYLIPIGVFFGTIINLEYSIELPTLVVFGSAIQAAFFTLVILGGGFVVISWIINGIARGTK